MASYKVLTGIEYPPNKRAEAGDVVSDIPASSVKWLLDQGIIEVVAGSAESAPKKTATKKVAPVGDDE